MHVFRDLGRVVEGRRAQHPQDGGAAAAELPGAPATRLKEADTPIGANDLWIACHALAEDATVVTHNTREFRRIAGLRVEDWVSSDED